MANSYKDKHNSQNYEKKKIRHKTMKPYERARIKSGKYERS